MGLFSWFKKKKKDIIVINIDKFIKDNSSAIPSDLFYKLEDLSSKGITTYDISKSLFEEIRKQQYEHIKFDFNLNEYNLNVNRGIECEKEKSIDDAIMYYEKAIHTEYPATHAYERLMVIYRKKKLYKEELRVIELALKVFNKENQRRINTLIEKYPTNKDELLEALETNKKVIRDNDYRVILSQYDVLKYIKRLEKVTKIIKNHK